MAKLVDAAGLKDWLSKDVLVRLHVKGTKKFYERLLMGKYRKPEPFITNEYCKYGCGKVATFKTAAGHLICGSSHNVCEVVKKKNGAAVKQIHDKYPELWDNRVISEDAKIRMNWNKGLTKETNSSVAQGGLTFKRKIKDGNIIPFFLGKKHTSKCKEQIGESRLKSLLKNGYDSSGKRGHRGFYNGMFFHSSWELAFYVYELEINKNEVIKNNKIRLNYFYDGREVGYIHLIL